MEENDVPYCGASTWKNDSKKQPLKQLMKKFAIECGTYLGWIALRSSSNEGDKLIFTFDVFASVSN